MRAGRNFGVGVMPTGVHALSSGKDALYTDVIACSHHHSVANGKCAIAVVFDVVVFVVFITFTRADGSGSVFIASLVTCPGNDSTASDGHIATGAFLLISASDAGSLDATKGFHLATADLDSDAGCVIIATNACTMGATLGYHRATGNGDLAHLSIKMTNSRTTNACTLTATYGRHRATCDGHISYITQAAASNAWSKFTTNGHHISAANGHDSTLALISAANACTILTAYGCHRAASNFHYATASEEENKSSLLL